MTDCQYRETDRGGKGTQVSLRPGVSVSKVSITRALALSALTPEPSRVTVSVHGKIAGLAACRLVEDHVAQLGRHGDRLS